MSHIIKSLTDCISSLDEIGDIRCHTVLPDSVLKTLLERGWGGNMQVPDAQTATLTQMKTFLVDVVDTEPFGCKDMRIFFNKKTPHDGFEWFDVPKDKMTTRTHFCAEYYATFKRNAPMCLMDEKTWIVFTDYIGWLSEQETFHQIRLLATAGALES